MKRFLYLILGLVIGLVLFFTLASFILKVLNLKLEHPETIISILAVIISVLLAIFLRKNKLLVISFLMTVVFISVFFTFQELTKETKKDSLSVIESGNVIETAIEKTEIDSALYRKVVDSSEKILSQLDNLNLIIRKQLDGDCYGTDSLFYDSKNNLIVEKSSSGCSADENYEISIYENEMLLYYEIKKGGDGLVSEIDKLYFNQNKAFYGTREKFEINYENRTVIDSKVSILTLEELSDLSKSKFSSNERLGNVIERISKLKISSNLSDKVVLLDTIQKVVEERKFIIDSALYKKLVK